MTSGGEAKKFEEKKLEKLEDYYWLNKDSRLFLERGYLIDGQLPEDRIKFMARRAQEVLEDNIKVAADPAWDICNYTDFSEKFIKYMKRGFYSLATPIWTNFGLQRGYPISCFNQTITDDMADILRNVGETGMMTKMGGGTSGYFGNLRGRGAPIKNNGVSSGAVHFMELFQSVTSVISQSNVRRGYFAAYLPIDHPDFYEFIKARETGHNIQHLALGVTVPAGFMQSVIDGDKENKKRWVTVLKKRSETGFPYILFEDNVDNNKPQVYKDKNLYIKSSNLCTEILEISDIDKSFVCCISSMNAMQYDEWKDTDAVEVLTQFLDCVYTDFIAKAKGQPFMEKAVRFAEENRSIGIGVLGYHSYLQSKLIPFESFEAKLFNSTLFKLIDEKSLEESKRLARDLGEPAILRGYGERFTTRIAVAPTTSSSFILGQVSPSIEPLASNYFLKDLAKGTFSYKNPELMKVLKEKGKNKPEIWESILIKGGSVQHLDFLSEHEKLVFKTFGEISQLEIIQQAAARQKFIDQSQSLNLMIHPETKVKDINALMIEAWKLGVKTLYYQRSANLAQEVSRELMNCVGCES